MEKNEKSPPSFVERRRFKRARYRTTLEIQSVATSESGNVFEVMHERVPLKDCELSEGGMGLHLPFSAEEGAVLKIRCRVGPEPDDFVEVFARVIWKKDGQIGTRFLMLENEARETIRGIVRGAMARKRRRTPPPS
jgi:hypothetical protein